MQYWWEHLRDPWGFQRWEAASNPSALSALFTIQSQPRVCHRRWPKGLGRARDTSQPPAHPVLHGWKGLCPGLHDSAFRLLLSHIHCLLSKQPRDLYSRTSAASNIANAESGFSARTSGLSNSITWKSEKNWNFQKKIKNVHTTALTGEAFEEVMPTRTSCTFPFSMTRTRSQLRTVFRRWAMVNTVQLLKASFTVLWTRVSVLESMEAVASSRRMIC